MGLFTVESFTILQGGVVKFNIREVRRDTQNCHDLFGAATCKGTTVAGYVRVLRFKTTVYLKHLQC